MKNSRFLMLAATFMGCVLSCPGQDYEYQFTAPIIGYFEQSACDANTLNGTQTDFQFGTLSETVFYNPTANTVQQIGSFTLNATSFSGSFGDPEPYPNGIPAIVSLVYTLNGGDNTVSFNSGVESLNGNGVNGPPSTALNWSIPFTEAITVTTGGESYSALMSGSVPDAFGTTSISQFTPESIVISQISDPDWNIFGAGPTVAISASDGWSSTIIGSGGDDGFAPETWQVDPVTAYAVPEPGSLTIFFVGGFGLMLALRLRLAGTTSCRPPF
jgi:hypothetical protein